MHGNTLDHPDRVFSAIEHSFHNALHDFSDVRECSPEFFYLPEMFENTNSLNFGKK